MVSDGEGTGWTSGATVTGPDGPEVSRFGTASRISGAGGTGLFDAGCLCLSGDNSDQQQHEGKGTDNDEQHGYSSDRLLVSIREFDGRRCFVRIHFLLLSASDFRQSQGAMGFSSAHNPDFAVRALCSASAKSLLSGAKRT